MLCEKVYTVLDHVTEYVYHVTHFNSEPNTGLVIIWCCMTRSRYMSVLLLVIVNILPALLVNRCSAGIQEYGGFSRCRFAR